MDEELESQIEELLRKTTKDLQAKIMKLTVRHYNKIIKDYERKLRATAPKPRRTQSIKDTKPVRDTKRKSKTHDTESDYYSN